MDNYSKIEDNTATNSVVTDINMRASRNTLLSSARITSKYVPNYRFSRYGNAMATLIPFRKSTGEQTLSVNNAGLFSFITFHWMWSYLWQAARYSILDILHTCPPPEASNINAKRLEGLWSENVVHQGALHGSMLRVVWRFIRTRIIFACVLYTIAMFLSINGLVYFYPMLMSFARQKYNQSEYENFIISYEEGFYGTFGLASTELIACLLFSWSASINLRTSLRLRSACFATVYRKALRTSVMSSVSLHQMVTFMVPDGQQVQELVLSIPQLICAPLVLILCTIYAVALCGYWGLLSVGIVILFYPILIMMALSSKKSFRTAMDFSDSRVKFLEEFVSNIVNVKMFILEDIFKNRILGKRKLELRNMKKAALYENLCSSFVQLQPLICVTALYIIFEFHIVLDPMKDHFAKFAALCAILLIHMKISMDNFWYGLISLIRGMATFEKLKKFLMLETVPRLKPKPNVEDLAVAITDGDFAWNDDERIPPYVSNGNPGTSQTKKNSLVLSEINMYVKKGTLIGICGPPGSGKTSLLLAILGHLNMKGGKVESDGRFAYVSQQPWLCDASIKENILFGEAFDTTRFYRSTITCSISDDICRLPNADDSQVGDVLLTMGQKQRIALARAVYADKDIYLLDNPLSGVDAKTRSLVFDFCILKSLQDKTVLLVTDNPEFLSQCDTVYMLKDGVIQEQGTHNELLQQGGIYTEFISYLNVKNSRLSTKDDSNLFKTDDNLKIATKLKKEGQGNDLPTYVDLRHSVDLPSVIRHQEEDDDISTSADQMYRLYLRQAGHRFSVVVLFVAQLLNAAFVASVPLCFINALKRNWFESEVTTEVSLIIFTGVFVVMLITGIIIDFVFNKKVFRSAKYLHNDWMERISSASVSYIPSLGDVLSTITFHLHITDMELPRLIHNIVFTLCLVVATAAVVCLASYWLCIIVVVMFIIYYTTIVFAKCTVLLANEKEVNSRYPMYNQIMTTLPGRSTIQAFRKESEFIKKFYSQCDYNTVCLYIMNGAKMWMNFILGILSVIQLICVGLSIIILNDMLPGSTGLAIVCTFLLCNAVQRFALLSVDTRAAFETLSCIDNYKREMKAEDNKKEHVLVPNDWPIPGRCEIAYQHVTVQPRNAKNPTLKDMSFMIKSNEKLGVFGLEESSKMSLVFSLFRLIELSKGLVTIGDQDISQVPLKTLRSAISIVPQEPVLFDGSILFNLNPRGEYTDHVIMEALQRVNLWERITKMPNKLDSLPNLHFTMGEKQLLCLARAYLKQSKVIIIEESTTNIGTEVEKIIHTSIRNLFISATVLLITQNVRSLTNCDRLMIIEEGKVVEMDKPEKLYVGSKSRFHALLVKANLSVESSF